MEEKICKHCNNYLLYYCNINGTFRQLGIGHCKLDNRKKRLVYFSSCGKWESNEELILNRNENIEKTLRNMAKDLNHIAQILKEDNL